MASNKVVKSSNHWDDLGGGVARQILGWDNQIMMVKVRFEEGAIGSEHTHFHTQTTYCISGKFEFSMDGEKVIVEPGDALYVSPNMLHGAICLKPGELIDVFSPVREDFL